jgi:molybdopterin molybdotransferase
VPVRRAGADAMSELLPVPDARAAVLAATGRLGDEPVALDAALGRALAEDVVAAGNVPPFDSSAMDGFAVVAGESGRTLEIVGESRAGTPSPVTVGPSTAVRISTGAAVPAGATAVAPVEETSEQDGVVVMRAEAPAGDNVRPAGDDMAAGELVLRAGTELGAPAIGLAAGAGRAEVRCARRPRVAVLVTGDELVDPGAPLGPGQIHESNGLTLAALVRRAGAELAERHRVPDDRDATVAVIGRALESADVLVLSGGVSVGPHDHVRPALEQLGVEQRFWRVALRPGKPTWFGTRGETLVFGLPGNPVSAIVTFHLFVKPALRALQGLEPLPQRFVVELTQDVRRNPRRTETVRVTLAHAPDGRTLATTTGPQNSHLLTSVAGADAIAFVSGGPGDAPAGSTVEAERL